MATKYWVGGSGDLGDTAHWSTSSGGAGGEIVNQYDDVIFDANSFSSTSVVTFDVAGGAFSNGSGAWQPVFNIFDASAIDESVTFDIIDGLNVVYAHEITLSANLTITENFVINGGSHRPTVRLTSQDASTANLTTNGATIYGTVGVRFGIGAELNDDLIMAANGSLYLEAGSSMEIGNNDVTVSKIVRQSSEYYDEAELSAGTSTITIQEAGGNNTGVSWDVVVADTSTADLVIVTSNDNATIFNQDIDFSTITIQGSGSESIGFVGSVTAGSFTVNSNPIDLGFTSGEEVLVDDFIINSGASNIASIDQLDLNLGDEVARLDYISLTDSTAPKTYFAGANSTDGGGNTNWQFTDPIFYSELDGTLLLAGANTAKKIATSSVDGTLLLAANIFPKIVSKTVVNKEYQYKVYDENDNFLGEWTNEVANDLNITQDINSFGSSVQVVLARSAERLVEIREGLVTEALEQITTELGESLNVVTEETQTIGEGTDVDLNYRVDITVFYGTFEDLTTEGGETITTEDDESILAGLGAPNGKRLFTGYVENYEAIYGQQELVTINLNGFGIELNNELLKSGSNTSVTHNSEDPSDIVTSILDTSNSPIDYTTTSVESTGTTVSYTYTLDTIQQALRKTLELAPDDWYFYVDQGENTFYFKQQSSTPDHTFVLGQHIKEVKFIRTMENLINEVYFAGGDTGGGTQLLKYYSDATSLTSYPRKGLDVTVDLRVTNASTAETIALDRKIERYKNPTYSSVVTILDNDFQIEDIAVGDTIGFRNFNNFVDDLVLQVVSMSYQEHEIRLLLDERVPEINKRIEDIARNQRVSDLLDVPTSPS